MGDARRRGTYEQRKAAAIAAGLTRVDGRKRIAMPTTKDLFAAFMRLTAPAPKKSKKEVAAEKAAATAY